MTGPNDDGSAAGESDSLISALNQVRVPLGNHTFIRKIIDGGGVKSFRANVEASKPHVIATRNDGESDLHIYYGYATRFASEEEVVRSSSLVDRLRRALLDGILDSHLPTHNL